MSFVTNFNFKAFATDLRARETLQDKNAFSLSLLSCDEMARMSVVDVSCRLMDKDAVRTMPWAPKTNPKKAPGVQWPTFWDTRMGNFDQRGFPTQPCGTCKSDDVGRFGNERCQGHFGSIRMPLMLGSSANITDSQPTNDVESSASSDNGRERLVVYNPHLFDELEALLQAECFFCHRFRAPRFDVLRYQWALVLIDFGFTGDALHLLELVASHRSQELRSHKRSREPNERIINDPETLERHVVAILEKHHIDREEIAEACRGVSSHHSGRSRGRRGAVASSLAAHDVRNQVVREALKEFKERSPDCSHCNAFSPRVTKKDSQFFFHFSKKAFVEFNLQSGHIDQGQLNAWDLENKRHRRSRTYYQMCVARDHIRELCTAESQILSLLFPCLGEPSIELARVDRLPTTKWHTVFFLDRLLVPPNPLRLSSGVQVQDGGTLSADPKTKILDTALGFVEQIESYHDIVRRWKTLPNAPAPTEAQMMANELNLRNLQLTVNEAYSTVLESFAKKEGLFRMHMMGKRVNQACRSVISPDYLVEPNEVLLPRPFARSLSFPEQIVFHSPARASFLKQCIVNGPGKYPGASHLEHRLANGEVRMIDLYRMDDVGRRQAAERIFAQAQQQRDAFIVYRHVVDGDRCVFNRQPTLHKPSMMGYRVRVLSGLKTIRFHYVNGKSYNADFDGDEMNVHIPQSIEARAELEVLMDANLNFLVPTSGKPLRGLIQDHIAAGVLLTTRDKFLDRDTFVQLLYFGLFPYLSRESQQHNRILGITLTELVPFPAIFKPRPLWTGKQLVSCMVRFVCRVHEVPGRKGPTLRGVSLIQPSAHNHTDHKTRKPVSFARHDLSDDRVVFKDGELLCGVLCKNQLGPSNMSVAHVINELYGAHAVGDLFGALGRILTMANQREGLSMGLDDMALMDEKRRSLLLRRIDDAPLGLPDDERAALSKVMEMTSAFQKEFLPGRMLSPFPQNQLLMMTVSGAKGSNTNAVQMALVLGQQLFDGQRVKRMNSGKTLPAFFTHERRARSFGFAVGRFVSGIRPPEYTIHAMAGRDGLIDTAVKTSRSGHLQRCLIKGLESLTVQWDHSVRDANGSVVQFRYGGDGLDPCKASTLTAWDEVKDNVEDFQSKLHTIDAPYPPVAGGEQQLRMMPRASTGTAAGERNENGKRSSSATTPPSDVPDDGDTTHPNYPEKLLRTKLQQEVERDPLPPHLSQSLGRYLSTKASYQLFERSAHVAKWAKQGIVAEKLREKRQAFTDYYSTICTEISAMRRVRSYCDAGEPVGLLAAQAAGEPSTQMTLNTFHSAGSTVTHVTEGIPRLRELLIHASVHDGSVAIPVVKAGASDEAAIARIIDAGVPIRLKDCLAPLDPYQSVQVSATRGSTGVSVSVTMLFSQTLLKSAAAKMCMRREEHVVCFAAALRQYVKALVNAMRGRGSGGGGSGGAAGTGGDGVTRSAVDDLDQLDGAGEGEDRPRKNKRRGAESLESESDDDDGVASSSSASDGIDSDADSERGVTSRTGAAPKDRGHRRSRRGVDSAAASDADDASEENRDDDNDDDDDVSQAGFDEGDEESAAMLGREETDCELDGSAGAFAAATQSGVRGAAAAAAVNGKYDAFAPITAAYGNQKFSAVIQPLSKSAHVGLEELPKDFFVVLIQVMGPPNTIAVMHDIVHQALSNVTFSTQLPQFEKIFFARSADDVSSGDLWFQGNGAMVRNAMNLVTLFGHTAPAIRVHQARSTDIRDMACALGIESAYQTLLDELNKLFKRYSVDPRHMTLIADAATHRGFWENYNFTGVISRSASPLFQMTFASSKKFLHSAVTRGVGDHLESISSAIIVGERPKVGTATVKWVRESSLLQDVFERTNQHHHHNHHAVTR